MKHSLTLTWLLLLSGFLFAQNQQITLIPSQDNSLYETAGTSLSNGAGDHLFAGRTMQQDPAEDQRRALLQFPVVDSLATLTLFIIDSVALQLHVSRAISDEIPFSLHRLTRAWGEAGSDAPGQEGRGDSAHLGDVTWLHAFHDTVAWDTPGGDYLPEASASGEIGRSGFFTFANDSGLVDDVNFWFNQPDSNFGWILIGGEGQMGSAKRFDSRENSDASKRPQLTIFYRLEQTSVDAAYALPLPLRTLANRHWKVTTKLAPAARLTTTLELLDLQGRNLLSRRGIAPTEQLDLQSLPSGFYFLRLRTEDGRLGVKKLVVR